MELPLIEQAKIEMRLGKAARGATEAKTITTRRKYINQLFELATRYARDLEELDGTNDPVEIAIGALVISTIDVRPIFDVPLDEIDPNDAYSLRIKGRQDNFPEAISLLVEKFYSN